MTVRRFAAATLCCAFCLILAGCDSGGVDALSANSDNSAAPSGGGGASAPKVLPKAKKRGASEAPGPLAHRRCDAALKQALRFSKARMDFHPGFSFASRCEKTSTEGGFSRTSSGRRASYWMWGEACGPGGRR